MNIFQFIVNSARWLLGRYSTDQYVTSGLGTAVNPYLGWESRVPLGVDLHFTDGKYYGVTNSAGVLISNENTDNYTRWFLNGATIKYAGSGTCDTLVTFDPGPTTILALNHCEFSDGYLDCRGSTATNQAKRAFVMRSSHYMTVEKIQVVGAGSNATDAISVLGCTMPVVDVKVHGGVNLSCTNFAHHLVVGGALNTFYGAYFPNTIGVFRIHSSTASNSGITVESTFGSKFFGASENSISGCGVDIGTNSSSLSLSLDLEGNGPPTAIAGVHSAVRLRTGTTLTAPRQILFDNSTAFDGAFQIDANVTGLTVRGGTWAGATNNSSSGITIDSAQGLDPTGNWQGLTTGVKFLNRANGAPDILPETIIGSSTGTNGLGINSASFGTGDILFYNVLDGIGFTKYILTHHPGASGYTVVNGLTSTYIRVGGNDVAQFAASAITMSQPITFPQIASNTAGTANYFAIDTASKKLMRNTGGTNWTLIG